ncbi:hypothetical protein UlMin_039196 [Ulmus minor]
MEDFPAAQSDVLSEQGETKDFSVSGAGKLCASPSCAVANGDGSLVDDDEDICRICRAPGEPDNPLRYPCACRGSIKYVHQDCQLQWLNRRKISRCEVCKYEFSFVPVYANNAPARLPPKEFVLGLAAKVFRLLGLLQHFAYFLFVWLFVIPFITHWFWELAFFKSFGEAQSLFLSHLTVTTILADCLHGFLLSLGIAYIFLGVTFIRVIVPREPRGAPGLVNIGVAANENEGNAGGMQGIAHIFQIIKRNAVLLADWWKVSIARVMVRIGIVEIAALNELVDMRAPLFPFDENAVAVIASNLVFIVVGVLLPFSLGRIATILQFWLFSSPTAQILSSLMPWIETAFLSVNTTVNDASNAITYYVLYFYGVDVRSQVSGGATEILNPEIATVDKALDGVGEQMNGIPVLSDDTTLFIGYVVILAFVLFYLGTISVIRYARGEPLALQRLSGIAFKIDAVLSSVRRFSALFRRAITMVSRNFLTLLKIAFVFGVKVGLFPLMCGWWLDLCTVRMFGQTIADRVELSVKHPVLMSLAYWTVGICYLLYVSIHLNLIRQVLRRGVLYFLPDIADQNNFFRRMIECPVYEHVCSILLRVGVHGSLIVMLVFFPVKLVSVIAPSAFPLNIFYSEAKTVAAIILRRCIFHFGIPCTVRFYYPSATFKSLLQKWLHVIGSILGLSEFLLPRDEGNDGNVEPLRRMRVRNLTVVAIIEGSIVGTHMQGNTDATEDNQKEKLDSQFALRILTFLVLAWITALVFNSLIMAIPLFLGRTLFQVASHLLISHGFKNDDVCSLIVGSCIIRVIGIGAKYAAEHVQTRGLGPFLSQIWQRCTTTFKICFFVLLWIFVVPILIGLLLALVMTVPIQLPLALDEDSVTVLFQYWILGLLFSITTIGLVIVDSMHSENERWDVKLEKLLNDGLFHRPALWVLQEILVPMTMWLLAALCTPYMLGRLILATIGCPMQVESPIHRFVWPGCFALSLMWFCTKIIYACMMSLHDSIRDDRYCVGQRLRDYGEGVGEKAKEDENTSGLEYDFDNEDENAFELLFADENDDDNALELQNEDQH